MAAVTESSMYHATEALILPGPYKHYRASMPATHWQLRAFVDSPRPNTVIYFGGPDIFRLNTISREREIITTLPFAPRCLVAANDWICCGGVDGKFAAIRLVEGGGRVECSSSEPETETEIEGPESRLSLDLDPPPRMPSSLHRGATTGCPRLGNSSSSARSTTIGTDIVNCVTLWFPPANDPNPTYHSPVAVLSNNDKFITIVDLEDIDPIVRLEVPDPVNRATISPDGILLAAVGDGHCLEVFERRAISGQLKPTRWHWTKSPTRIRLHGQVPNDKNDMRGTFAAEFSPSGRYLALGTQYGSISIFDVRTLTDSDTDSLLVTFTTTRPKTAAGAVRAMQFSPGPLDLLAWTEDSGRVVIADIRQEFISRQTIDFELGGENFTTVGVVDRSNELLIDPRLRGYRSGFLGGTADNTTGETRSNHDGVSTPPAFIPEETEVLELLQMQRRRRERDAAREAAREAAHSASSQLSTQIITELADDIRSTYRSNQSSEPRSSAQSSTMLPSSLREFISSRSNDSLRAYIRERNEERERRGGNQPPRRRGSVILAAAHAALERDETGARPLRNPWADLDALSSLATQDYSRLSAGARALSDMESTLRDDMLRLRRQSREVWRSNDDRYTVRVQAVVSGNLRPSHPNQTTGCSWSPDGRQLYVGTETGIYELNTNSMSRRLFPSISVR